MKIHCPSCNAENLIQNYCGSCGAKLLSDGVMVASPDPEDSRKVEQRTSSWLAVVGLFCLVWVGGSVILSILFALLGMQEIYAGALAFVAAIVATLVFSNKNAGKVESSTLSERERPRRSFWEIGHDQFEEKK